MDLWTKVKGYHTGKKSIAGFKIRQGQTIGCEVTLATLLLLLLQLPLVLFKMSQSV